MHQNSRFTPWNLRFLWLPFFARKLLHLIFGAVACVELASCAFCLQAVPCALSLGELVLCHALYCFTAQCCTFTMRCWLRYNVTAVHRTLCLFAQNGSVVVVTALRTELCSTLCLFAQNGSLCNYLAGASKCFVAVFATDGSAFFFLAAVGRIMKHWIFHLDFSLYFTILLEHWFGCCSFGQWPI